MPDISPEQLNLGAVAIIFLFFLKEFFTYLKSRKYGNGASKDLLKEVQLMNSNHLSSILTEMTKGNSEVVGAINNMNKEIGDKIDNLNTGISRLIGRGDK